MKLSHKACAALMFLGMLTPAIPAAADEAIVDGVRYRVPEGTGFFLPMPHAETVSGADVQAAIDRYRSAGPSRPGADILFWSKPTPGKPFVALLTEPQASSWMDERRARISSMPRVDGVASSPASVIQPDDGSTRDHFLETGLAYAPEAMVSCRNDTDGTVPCLVILTMDARLRLILRDFPIDETSGASLRRTVVAAITATMPDGMPRR